MRKKSDTGVTEQASRGPKKYALLRAKLFKHLREKQQLLLANNLLDLAVGFFVYQRFVGLTFKTTMGGPFRDKVCSSVLYV